MIDGGRGRPQLVTSSGAAVGYNRVRDAGLLEGAARCLHPLRSEVLPWNLRPFKVTARPLRWGAPLALGLLMG